MKAAGATALRGGAFKPRTSPYSFQGLKEEGLKLLAAAREADRAGGRHRSDGHRGRRRWWPDYADVLQIGARNMQNYRLLEAVGETRPAGAAQARPQRHDRRVAAGRRVHPQRRQPERDALRARHPHVRSAHPLHAAAGHGALPARRRRTCRWWSIPATARATRYLVPQMAAASVAAGADGLILEVHPDPEKALSDGYQSLNFAQFEETMVGCRRIAEAVDRKLGA